MKNKILKILFIGLIALNAACVFAVDLQQVKSEGLIGEQLNGYLGVVSADADAEVRGLVVDVNAKRKAKYQSIAAKNSTSLETVELLAGKKAIEKTQAGNYIQTAAGWKKK
ncbi:MAG: YdbL family protein [Gammaproteobacteria bacterium]|nr:YdbL family protein [Gammaproteobacteria bacterium]